MGFLRTGGPGLLPRGILAATAILSLVAPADADIDPYQIVAAVVASGPRLPGTPAHLEAGATLLESMRLAGLQDVAVAESGPTAPWLHLRGVLSSGVQLPYATESIVVSAHYDTVLESPGALDDASGCAVALAASSRLARTPRSRTVETILFDGEESQAAGSRAWLQALSEQKLGSIFANLNLEVVGRAQAGPGILGLVHLPSEQGWQVTPAWLVHVVLEAGRSQGIPLAVADRNWSWFAQLAARFTRSSRISDADNFQQLGIPAVVLSDASWSDAEPSRHRPSDLELAIDSGRLDSWVTLVAAAVRKMDAMPGRPVDEQEYLVVFGRVWVRRNLVWLGFSCWILMVWRGLPGGWRGAGADQRRRRGRNYLPGFAFRMLLLLAVFLIPTATAVLLVPAVLLGFGASFASDRWKRWLLVVATLPSLTFALWLMAGQLLGWFVIQARVVLPASLVVTTIGSLSVWLLEDSNQASDP